MNIRALIKKYDGVLSGEHNDGLIRSPFLEKMYDKDIYALFKKTKKLFDPDNIFNPHKKTDADWEYSKEHMRARYWHAGRKYLQQGKALHAVLTLGTHWKFSIQEEISSIGYTAIFSSQE